jgi:hypothetical protein
MNNNTIVKIILFTFFTSFFAFLFWYFYQPEIKLGEDGNPIEDRSFLNLFPFSNSEVNNNSNIEEKELVDKQQDMEPVLEVLPRLRQISNIPTAGVHIESISKIELFDVNKNRKESLKLDSEEVFSEIRYISMKNNHIFQTYDFTKTENRISNITIPRISSTYFFNKNNFIIRYKNQFGDKKNYSVTLSNKSEEEKEEEKKGEKESFDIYEKKFQGIFFPDNIEDIYINSAQQKVFYTTYMDTNGNIDNKIHGIISTKKAEDKKEIFTSLLKEWNISFNNVNNILISNKVSSTTQSIPFLLNTKTTQLSQVVSGRTALQGIPNYDFSKIVFSYRNAFNKLEMSVYDVKTKEERVIEVSTFVEKCVWSKNNIDIYCGVPIDFISDKQPDDWYKGKKYFKDDILKINTDNLEVDVILDSILEEKTFDIIDLKIDDREKYLYWKNKITDFVWSYRMPYSVFNTSFVPTTSSE